MVEAAQILIYDVTNQIFGNHSDTDILASTPRVENRFLPDDRFRYSLYFWAIFLRGTAGSYAEVERFVTDSKQTAMRQITCKATFYEALWP
jgi:hypothetical protein